MRRDADPSSIGGHLSMGPNQAFVMSRCNVTLNLLICMGILPEMCMRMLGVYGCPCRVNYAWVITLYFIHVYGMLGGANQLIIFP